MSCIVTFSANETVLLFNKLAVARRADMDLL